jgi:monofunctional biosynthetic peptidoglycan transglycosylase
MHRLRFPSRRTLAVALAAVGALYLAALAVASSAPVERRLRDAIQRALRARVGEVRLGEEVRVDPLFRVRFGPLELPGPRGGPPLVRVAKVVARPSLLALLRGRADPASIFLGDVRVHPGPGGRDLRELVERLQGHRAFGEGAAAGGAEQRDLPRLKLRGLVVTLPRSAGPLDLGPLDADLVVERGGAGPRLSADVSLRAGGRVTVAAERGAAGWTATLRASRLGPETMPATLRNEAAAITGGEVTIAVDAEAPADLSSATALVRAEIEGLVLAGERVGPEPVGPLRAAASGRLAWDGAARRVTLTDGAATTLGAATLAASGEVTLGSPATFSMAIRAEVADWAALVAALPPALAVPPHAPRPSGRLSGRLDVAGPLLVPEEWTVQAGLDLGPLRDAARRAGRPPLADPFVHRPPLDGGGRGPELRVGPQSPDFVPVAELPEHVVRAVTTSEDAGFFGHPGFELEEVKNAIAQGVRRGRLVRGGSTISQQVAKNLFLDGERTFARKVREAVATVGLEATLPKRRILEIYLNVAEWGPGVWGIGPAAHHWFGKDARALTPKEAAVLAAVIPNPVRYHEQLFARGELTEAWENRVRGLLFTMAEQGALSEPELFGALAQPVTFSSAATAAVTPPRLIPPAAAEGEEAP